MASELISGRSNSRIKAIRKLRTRPERDRTGTFLVEGIRQVSEAIQSGAEILELLVAPDLLRSPFAIEQVDGQIARGTPVITMTGDVFATISERDRPHGLAAVVRQRWEPLTEITLTPDSLWVASESIADPGNLGTILRTADAVGASGAILLGQSTDPFDPAVARASMGAIFTQRVVRTSTSDLLKWARQNKVQLVGTSPDATVDYHDVDYPSPLVLLMGSERHGLSQDLLRASDLLVRLPMTGRVDSLNLAVATGVMLYEIFNQRRAQVMRDDHRGRRSRRRVESSGKAGVTRKTGSERRRE